MSDAALTTGVEIFTLLWLAIVSISHILYPRAWASFYTRLRELGRIGAFAHGFLALIFGSIIAAFHHVWTWPGIAVTLIGWVQVVKGAVAFIAPQLALKGFGMVSPDKAWKFRAAGAVLLLATVWLFGLLYGSWTGVIP